MKILVEIDLYNHGREDYESNKDEWHPTGDPDLISVDKAYLPDDPTDGCFTLLRLVRILDDGPAESAPLAQVVRLSDYIQP